MSPELQNGQLCTIEICSQLTTGQARRLPTACALCRNAANSWGQPIAPAFPKLPQPRLFLLNSILPVVLEGRKQVQICGGPNESAALSTRTLYAEPQCNEAQIPMPCLEKRSLNGETGITHANLKSPVFLRKVRSGRDQGCNHSVLNHCSR